MWNIEKFRSRLSRTKKLMYISWLFRSMDVGGDGGSCNIPVQFADAGFALAGESGRTAYRIRALRRRAMQVGCRWRKARSRSCSRDVAFEWPLTASDTCLIISFILIQLILMYLITLHFSTVWGIDSEEIIRVFLGGHPAKYAYTGYQL